MHPLDFLTRYAAAPRPDRDIPSDVYLLHDPHTVTVFDKFPKAKYHFLVLPRLPFHRSSPLDASDTESPSETESETPTSSPASHPAVPSSALASLHALLSTLPTATSLYVLRILQQATVEVVEMIKDEMLKTEGFEWGIQVGFHAVPSMRTLHVHVISTDFIAPTLRVKKHYTSFHPTLGFFLPLNDVIHSLLPRSGTTPSPFDLATYIRPNGPKSWEPILKSELGCWRCRQVFGTMPALKSHLEDEWSRLKSGSAGPGKGAVPR